MIDITKIPAKMFQLRQWCVWRLEPPEKEGAKWKKMPRTITGGHGDSTNPARWVGGQEATDAYTASQSNPKPLSGIGFVFYRHSPFRFTGMDFDGWTWEQVKAEIGSMANGYVELSQSGGGIHVIVLGTLPPEADSGKKDSKTGIEAYDDERYFAITGNVPPELGTPDLETDHTAELAVFYEKHLAHLSRNKSPGARAANDQAAVIGAVTPEDNKILEKILQSRRDGKRLHKFFYDGEPDERKQSEADFDLACLLCRATADDVAVERMMWASALHRPKWDKHKSYLDITIRNARINASAPGAEKEEIHARARVRSFDQIPLEKISWLWPGVIPYGKLTMVIGDPGWGKSFITLDLASRLSTGASLPDSGPLLPQKSMLVFYEDDAGATVRSRLEAAKGDLTRINYFEMAFEDGSDRLVNLDLDIIDIEMAIVENQCRLLVFDPLSAYLGDKTNAWKDDEVRRLLARVGKMAERTHCAIVAVMHLNKKQTTNVLQRATGAGAFVAVARSVWLVGLHPEDKGIPRGEARAMFAPAKMNLAKIKGGWGYKLVQPKDAIDAHIEWGPQTTYTAEDMAKVDMTGVSDDGTIEAAFALLTGQLSGGAEISAKEMGELAKINGISERTLERAKKALLIKSVCRVVDGGQKWFWHLPSNKVDKAPAPHQDDPGPVDENTAQEPDGDLPPHMHPGGF